MSKTWQGLPFSWSRLFTRVGWGGEGGGRGDDLLWGGGGGRGDDLLLNAVLFVPKWSGLSGRYLSQVFDAFVFIRKHSDIFSEKIRVKLLFTLATNTNLTSPPK